MGIFSKRLGSMVMDGFDLEASKLAPAAPPHSVHPDCLPLLTCRASMTSWRRR